MKKLATLGLVGLLGMAGCGKEIPKKEDYKERPGIAMGKLLLFDANDDGVVDYISNEDGSSVIMHAEGFEQYAFGTRGEVMPPEIRKLASQVRKLQQELRYKMDLKNYQDSQR